MTPTLFDFAAERVAIATGLPVSQASLRVRNIDAAPSGPLLDSALYHAAPCARAGKAATSEEVDCGGVACCTVRRHA